MCASQMQQTEQIKSTFCTSCERKPTLESELQALKTGEMESQVTIQRCRDTLKRNKTRKSIRPRTVIVKYSIC